MKDVIIDTYRAKSRTVGYRRRRRSRNWPKDRSQEKMKTPYRWEDTRQQTDKLTPLWRALRSKVGSPWNEIYSEVCQSADGRNIRGYHIRDHVSTMVDYSYEDENGVVMLIDKGVFVNHPKPIDEHRPFMEILYVDPKGVLRIRPPVKTWDDVISARKAKKRPNYFIETSEGSFYKSEDHIWYRVKLEPVSTVEERWRNFPEFYDHVARSKVSYSQLVSLYGKAVRCVDKKQLSSKELKKYKFKNGEN